MTVAQAAKKIGISPSKLYQLTSARCIPHYRIGGKIVFDEEDIATFRARCHVDMVQPTITPPLKQPRLKHINLG